jgi:hypothetical protein
VRCLQNELEERNGCELWSTYLAPIIGLDEALARVLAVVGTERAEQLNCRIRESPRAGRHATMSAESPHRIFDCLLSGSDPVEAVDDVLRSVNSSHGAFESPLVHTLGFVT